MFKIIKDVFISILFILLTIVFLFSIALFEGEINSYYIYFLIPSLFFIFIAIIVRKKRND